MPTSEAKLLKNAFNEFNRASDSLVNYYNLLENQIRGLKDEVEEKNRELEKAREYLHFILNSLPVGVLVLDKNSVLFSNSKAERFGWRELMAGMLSEMPKTGELKSKRGHFRWNKEALTNGFGGKEVIVVEDVTEMEKMKERLERDDRLKAMGEMAARISHEIKNPLGSMELFLSMMAGEKRSAKDKKYIDYVRFGVNTIDRIINNLLSYTRPKTLVLKEESLSPVVSDILDFMSISTKSRNISVTFSSQTEGKAFFDPDLMRLVIMNCISNAIDAVKQNGCIDVTIREGGNHVVVVVSDNGMGMPEDIRKNIFDPFFTTKDKGVGLGLFIVHNIVKAHGGYIEVESTEGSGSSFYIHVPKDKS